MRIPRNFWRTLLMVVCAALIVGAVSKTDALSCERQNAPRHAQIEFYKSAAAVSAGRRQGDLQLAQVVKTSKVRSALQEEARAEKRYHARALQLAKEVPPLACDGPFPTAH